MSKAFTTKAVMDFEPGVSGLALNSTGQKHQTADAWAPKLGDLAMLPYRRGRFAYKLRQSGSATTGTAKIEIMAGTVVLDTITLSLNGSGGDVTGAVDLDLSSVAGETGIKMRLSVDTAADTAITADLWGRLEVSTPLIVSTC